jgi:FKBP-type peptidyl-prolyl cis-trans isomerase FklB
MKKLLLYIAVAGILLPATASCSSDDDNATTWDAYAEYREANVTWVAEKEATLNADGSKFYERLEPTWNPNNYILIHWFNDRSETAGNLRPLLTSSVRARYIGRNYLGVVFDADSTSEEGTEFSVSSVIDGWQTALQYMNVGDTVEIVLPYQQAYGSSTVSDDILPYSALQFNMRLTDVSSYEVRP